MMIRKKSKAQYVMPVLFSAIIIGFLGFGIFPQHRNINTLDLEIERLKKDIEVQRTLGPLHAALLNKSKMGKFNPPLPEKGALDRREIGHLADILKAVAEEHGYEMESVLPQLNAPGNTINLLPVDFTANGYFENLRAFMVALISLPYLEHVEKVEFKRAAPKDRITFRIWLNLR